MESAQFRRSRQFVAFVVLFALLSSACGGSDSTEAEVVPTSEVVTTTTQHVLIKEAAYLKSGALTWDFLTVELGDDFVEINSGGGGFPKVQSFLTSIGCSGSVAARMQQTRALDGTQRASCEFAELSWTYHPKDGLGIVAEAK